MIVLASASPRRREILMREGINFTVDIGNTEEKFSSVSPEVMAMSFAFEKAFSSAKRNPKALVLGADTVVAVGDRILGKPENKGQAREFLNLLSGREHRVITGFSLISLDDDFKIIDYDETFLKFRELKESDIEEYISTKEPYDKAGGYGIQGEADKFLEHIKGSFDNVVGLPVEKIIRYLREL